MADRPYDDLRVVAIAVMEVQPREIRRDVFEALGEPNMSAEDAKLQLEKLDALLSPEGSATLYALASWLKALGLKLTVAVDAGDAGDEESSASVAELAQVGNV